MKNRITRKFFLLVSILASLATGYSQWESVDMTGVDTAYLGTNVMIAVGTRLFVGANALGIYMSDDNGVTWTAANTGIDGNETAKGFLLEGGLLYVSLNRDGVYVTDPAVVNWTKLTGSSENLPTNQDYTRVIAIEDTLYVGTKGSSVYSWVIGGTNWIKLPNPSSASVLAVANDHGRLIVGLDNTTGFNRFNHATDSWTADTIGLQNMGVTYLFVSGTKIYAGTVNKAPTYGGSLNRGVFMCTSDSFKWTRQVKNMPNYGNQPVNYIDTISGKIVIATNNAGVWESNPADTLNWSVALLKQTSIRGHCVLGTSFFVSTSKGVFSSEMATWSRKSTGLPRTTTLIRRIIENGGKYYAATTSGVYESATGNGGWSLYGKGSEYCDVSTIIFRPTGTFAVINGSLYKLNGVNWEINAGLANVTVLDKVYGYRDGATEYLFCGSGWTGVPCGIQRSTDGGATWTQYNTQLVNTWDSCWKTPAACREGLYVGTDLRYTLGDFVYDTGSKTLFTNGKYPIIFSTDNGTTWRSRRAKSTTQNVRYVFTRTYKGNHFMFNGAQNDGGGNLTACRGLISDTVVTNSVGVTTGQAEGASMADFGEDLLFVYGGNPNLLLKSENNGTNWVSFTTGFDFTGYNKTGLLTRAGNYLYVGKGNGTAMRYDMVTPASFNTAPAVSGITQIGAMLTVNPSRPGIAYYVVLRDTATAPSAAQVVAGTDAFGNAVVQSGNFGVQHNVNTNVNLVGLTANTDYTVYVVVRNEVRLNSVVADVSFSTMAFNVTLLITNTTGTPISGAIVTFDGMNDTTAANGLAEYTDVEPAAGLAYSVSATPIYATEAGTIDIIGNTVDTIVLDTQKYTVTFLVSNSAFTPISGAIVTFGSIKDTTDGTGIATFTNVVPGNGKAYQSSAAGYKDTTGTVDVTGNLNDTIIMDLLDEVSGLTSNGVSIYPVPATDRLTVKIAGISGNVTLQVSDMAGKSLIITSQNVVGVLNTELDLSSLPAGSYILKVSCGEQSAVKKIIKE